MFEEEEFIKRREVTSYSTSTTSAGQVFVGLRASDRTMLREPLCNVLLSVVCLPTAMDCLGTPLIKGVKNVMELHTRRCASVWECRNVLSFQAAYVPLNALTTFTCQEQLIGTWNYSKRGRRDIDANTKMLITATPCIQA